MNLFGDKNPDSGAVFGDDPLLGRQVYRYRLWRKVGEGDRRVGFVMLNPSTADALKNDPTIRRCVAYARDWGYGWLEVGNLFAWRSPSPASLREAFYTHRHIDDSCPKVVGPENDLHLVEMAKACELMLAAWGTNGTLGHRAERVVKILAKANTTFRVLATNADGSPGHPLYLPSGKKPIVWAQLPTPWTGPEGRKKTGDD